MVYAQRLRIHEKADFSSHDKNASPLKDGDIYPSQTEGFTLISLLQSL